MEHRPFPKIPARPRDGAAPGGPWVATEKIHGAQLVVATDGEEVRFGKRKAWLDDDAPFLGWQLVRAGLCEAVRAIHATLGRGGDLYLYGELFGGGYPHADVAALPGLSPVQTGIWYAPGLAWAPFDGLHAPAGDAAAVFLAHDQLTALADAVGLITPPRLGVGTRRELMALDVRFPTRVPALLGLPELADNIAEGFVLKPAGELPAAGRPLIKHKIPEFSEARFDESAAFDDGAYLSLAELLQLAAAMVNAARIASARSKVGEAREALVDEVILDVWIDLEALLPRRMAALGDEEEQALRAGLAALADQHAR
ncbi:MAG: RNA ligase [Myxococcales bacterium]|nr:RNA ligase [Myxococcales bacterium]